MDYMHLLVGHPTQKSKKSEVCYVLGDVAYVRPKRLKEDAKVAFIDWPDTVLGRLQTAYDRVPLKDDCDSVLVDYRKLVGCLKDAFIALTDGSYESSEVFEDTCSDSELRRVFLASLEVFNVSVVLPLKTDDVWKLLEDLEVSVNFDKAVFNRLQERYLDKGFSVFDLPEALIGHNYGTIREGSTVYKQLLFDLIHPFDATFLVNMALTTLAKIKQGVFESEVIDGQLLNVIGDWLHYYEVTKKMPFSLNEMSKDARIASYERVFEQCRASVYDLNGVSLHLFNDVKLSPISVEDVKEDLLKPLNRVSDKDVANSIADSLSSEIDVMPLERTTSLFDKSLASLKTATSEFASDTAEILNSVDLDVTDLSETIARTSEEHRLNSLSYSEALLSEVAVDDFPVLRSDGESNVTYVKQSIADLEGSEISGVYIADDIKPPVFTWPADNKEFRELASSEVLEDYAVEHSVNLFDYWHGQPLIVTDKKPGFYTAGLEIALDRLPPKDVLKNVYVDYSSLRAVVQLCLLRDVFDIRVMIDALSTVFDAIGRGDYANDDVLRGEKIKFLRSGLSRCLLEVKGNVVSPLWDNQTDDQFGFDVKTVQQVLTNFIKIYGRNEGTIEHWFSVSDDIKRLIKQALDYVLSDTMFVKVPVSLKHTEFSDWLSDKECDALSQLLFFDAKKIDWYRSKAIEKDLMEQYKDCSLLSLDFLKDDTVTNPSRYRKNKIEAWDFTIQSLLPHPLATVAEYVIRYPYKGGREDLEKALAWAKKAEQSLPYLQATVGYGDSIVDDLPKVTEEMFPDCSEGQRDVLRAVQKATLTLRGSLGYGEPEDALRDVIDGVKTLLEEM